MIFRVAASDYFEKLIGITGGGKLWEKEEGLTSLAGFPTAYASKYFQGEFSERLEEQTECPAVTVFRRPVIPADRLEPQTVATGWTKKTFKLRDFMHSRVGPVVSQAFADILAAHDDFPHQLAPVEIVSPDGDRLNETAFYWLFVRRTVAIDPDGSPYWDPDFTRNRRWRLHYPERIMRREDGSEERPIQNNFSANGKEEAAIATIQANEPVRRVLESYPIWRWHNIASIVPTFMNKTLFDAVLSQGLTGFIESKHTAPNPRENVGHV